MSDEQFIRDYLDRPEVRKRIAAGAAGGGAPTGAAGGVLGGTYPNPSFAEDMATQAELTTAVAGKADTSHTHAESDITNLTTDLAAKQPLDSDLTAIAALTTTSYGRSLLAAADAAALRTLAGTVIGTDVQAYDAELAALAGLTSAADKLPYFTGSGTASVTTFTTAGRALVDDADATAQRTTLGLGSIATQASNSVSITGGSITGITDLAVADGGTGASTAATARSNLGLSAGTFHSPPHMVGANTGAQTADRCYYWGVVIPCDCTITGIRYYYSSGTGNVRSAMYDSGGTRVANRTTNLAVPGGAGPQDVPFDNTYAAVPGLYFLSVVFSSTPTVSQTLPTTSSGYAAGPGSGATLTSLTPPTSPHTTRMPVMGTY